VDRLLATIVSRAMKRGLRGEPLWLVVGAGAWLFRRARQKSDETIWRGRIEPGEHLEIRAFDASSPGPAAAAEG
jgi:hypothetical protein